MVEQTWPLRALAGGRWGGEGAVLRRLRERTESEDLLGSIHP